MKETDTEVIYPHQSHTNINMATWVGDYLPERGKCPLCGLDARHRFIDAIRAAAKDQAPPEDLAEDYGLTVAFVYRLIKENPYQRDQSRR
jgi:hypothetical protein